VIIAAGKLIAQGAPDQLREQVMAGSRLIAEIRGPTDAVQSAVQGVPGVSKVAADAVDGWCRLSITVDGKQDVREPVAKLAGEKGWGIRELRREVASLEDFFVKVIAQQQGGAAGRE
jgi:ABC-type multidrug transport system ATPase subunit